MRHRVLSFLSGNGCAFAISKGLAALRGLRIISHSSHTYTVNVPPRLPHPEESLHSEILD